MKDIKLKLEGKEITIVEPTRLIELLPDDGRKIMAARVNNRLRELRYTISEDAVIDFIDLKNTDGLRIYSRSLIFILLMAAKKLFPDRKMRIEHAMPGGLYCDFLDCQVTYDEVKLIRKEMQDLISADIEIERKLISKEDAIEIFEEEQFYDKIELLKYRPEEKVHVYKCNGYINYLYGYMIPSTGFLSEFELLFHLPGMILRYPRFISNGEMTEYVDSEKLDEIFMEARWWQKQVGVSTVSELNSLIDTKNYGDLIRVCEAQQGKKIAEIADEINNSKNDIRLILIAGPSSSGKTTFSKRLRIQLMANGINPISISLDDYYKERDQIPLEPDGTVDLEKLDTIDVELFNKHMSALIQGEAVRIPKYHFPTGKRKYHENMLKLKENQPIIVEGIHGLNDKLSYVIPNKNKYKIFVSALTQLNLDDHNRISTSDTRLIRRMIRDKAFRNTSPYDTIDMWYSVRRGERKYIFPYQENADIMFNSALIYELGVLKPYIIDELKKIKSDSKHYIEANRLVKFLKYFRTIDPEDIPNNSLLREFIGGSCFYK